jgi:hypothetical protein
MEKFLSPVLVTTTIPGYQKCSVTAGLINGIWPRSGSESGPFVGWNGAGEASNDPADWAFDFIGSQGLIVLSVGYSLVEGPSGNPGDLLIKWTASVGAVEMSGDDPNEVVPPSTVTTGYMVLGSYRHDTSTGGYVVRSVNVSNLQAAVSGGAWFWGGHGGMSEIISGATKAELQEIVSGVGESYEPPPGGGGNQGTGDPDYSNGGTTTMTDAWSWGVHPDGDFGQSCAVELLGLGGTGNGYQLLKFYWTDISSGLEQSEAHSVPMGHPFSTFDVIANGYLYRWRCSTYSIPPDNTTFQFTWECDVWR